jgi:cytochrome P450
MQIGRRGLHRVRRLDLTRYAEPGRSPRHVGFSLGAYYCLGAPLARLEASTAIGTLVRRGAYIDRPATADTPCSASR